MRFGGGPNPRAISNFVLGMTWRSILWRRSRRRALARRYTRGHGEAYPSRDQHSYPSRPRLRQSGFNRRGAVFFGHKKPAERIGGARAVLPRKIFELMGPELVPDCIVAATHLIVGETAIDLGGSL